MIRTIPPFGENRVLPTTLVRVLLILDKQTNSSQADPGQILNAGSTASSTQFSYLNPNGYGRFTILKDILLDMEVTAAANDTAANTISFTGNVKHFIFEHKFKPHLQVNFNATNGGTVADIIDNSFHIIGCSSDITLTPEISYYSRVCYTDA